MNAIAFSPQFNTGTKRDATGAFQPEAKAWFEEIAGSHPGSDVRVFHVDNHLSAAKMRAFVYDKIGEAKPDRIAFFCHGWPTGIQFGFNLAHIEALADCIASISDPIVAIFGCLTGDGPGNGDGHFADMLRDALCSAGSIDCRVDAHTTAGHCARNPYVRRFDGLGSPVGGMGGQWIVATGSALWKPWRKALEGDLRFRFSGMEIADIHRELVG
jgi:hypothetical protein